MGASPRVVDWNSDGRKDLIVGEKVGGKITIFLNTGSDSSPVLSYSGYVQVGGVNFAASGGDDSVPCIVDWNNDGRFDILSGGFDGRVTLLLNSSSGSTPAFSSSSFVQDGAGDLDVGDKSGPCVVDWNGDGKKDLLVSGSYSGISYFENVGTDAAPVFNGYTVLSAGGLPIEGENPRAVAADWDGDGVLDLIVGRNDATLWFYKRTANDDDGDGMLDWWENRFLPGGTNDTATADSDGDGVNNGAEFRCNTDPSDSNSLLRMESVVVSGTDVILSWQNATGVSYVVEGCADLASGIWTNLSSSTNGSSYVLPLAEAKQFYRIAVQ